MRILLFLLALCISTATFSQKPSRFMRAENFFDIPFEKNDNYTSTYDETIKYYQKLDRVHPKVKLLSYGTTDSGHPIHLAVLSTDQDFDPVSIRQKGKYILMINNGIHPGEPCGVEASMLLLRDYLEKYELQKYLDNLVIIIIPMYNIGGSINRSSTSRANQNGPEGYGFRGNAKNLDLNRDFIKCDSKNAQTFNQIFTEWQPDVFIDNHTSNGADYQYTMTLIPTQEDKMDKNLGEHMRTDLLPYLFDDMKSRNWEMTPYVFARNTPDDGIASFLDLGRYSSGYAALFNTISFMPETHMLKPYKDRVASTRAFSESMIMYFYNNGDKLKAARNKAIENTKNKANFALNWEMDTNKKDDLLFKGYTAKYKKSEVSGLDRLYYDRNEPYEKIIPWWRYYSTNLTAKKPVAYIIPQAYAKIIERLQWNGVVMEQLEQDEILTVEMYRIDDFKTTDNAYEAHYLHSEIQLTKETVKWQYHKGDYRIYTNQRTNRYLMETLEPNAPDSWFAWNFFDGILMQKEYFSSYVFEDLAAEYLAEQPELRKQLEEKRKNDTEFAASAYKQLEFVYLNSPWHEDTYRLYPVGRVMAK